MHYVYFYCISVCFLLFFGVLCNLTDTISIYIYKLGCNPN